MDGEGNTVAHYLSAHIKAAHCELSLRNEHTSPLRSKARPAETTAGRLDFK